MIALKKFLEDRLSQLEHRKFMIPKYVANPDAWLGKNDFSLNDLPRIEEEIIQAQTCLKALERLKMKAT